jgi:prepilin-type N-terminal cleavage/methylation domain-containing protein
MRKDEQRMKRTREKGNITMRRLRDMRGMTLLEVTIALFVLAIGLLGLAGLQLVALRGDTLGQQATLATTLAKDKVAELQETDQLTNGSDTYVDQANGVTYARQWIVQPELSELSHMERVTVKVQVSWQGAMVDRAVTVNAVVSRS